MSYCDYKSQASDQTRWPDLQSYLAAFSHLTGASPTPTPSPGPWDASAANLAFDGSFIEGEGTTLSAGFVTSVDGPINDSDVAFTWTATNGLGALASTGEAAFQPYEFDMSEGATAPLGGAFRFAVPRPAKGLSRVDVTHDRAVVATLEANPAPPTCSISAVTERSGEPSGIWDVALDASDPKGDPITARTSIVWDENETIVAITPEPAGAIS